MTKCDECQALFYYLFVFIRDTIGFMENPRIAVNLTEEDNELLMKAKAAIEDRLDFKIPLTEAIRFAIKALAQKEGV